MRALFPALVFALAARAGIVSDVREALARNDFAAAEARIEAYQRQKGTDPEMIEAQSWLGRGALKGGRLDEAAKYAAATRELVLAKLKSRKLDDEPHMPIALGASIEVQAGVMERRGERAQAVSFLRQELKSWWATSIRARIQKNLNLLTLEGKPAPALDVSHWLGTAPEPLAKLRGRVVLLFFWAHWCPECKRQIPALVRLRTDFGPRGLVLVGPTQRYGYAARGEDASSEVELRYIDQVREKFYAPLQGMPVPVSEENFRLYGASTVPTLVLIDRRGIVRLYHPNEMGYEDLAAKVRAALAK